MTTSDSTATSPNLPLATLQHQIANAAALIKLIADASAEYGIDEDHDAKVDVFRCYEAAANLLDAAYAAAEQVTVAPERNHSFRMQQLQILHVREYCTLLSQKAGQKGFDRCALSTLAAQLVEDLQLDFDELEQSPMEHAA